MDGVHVFTFPLMCWYMARQGSSGKGSWENTESSLEEHELRVSGKLGEYCSVGAHRSRYSCRWRKERVGSFTPRHKLICYKREKRFKGVRVERPRANKRT